MAGERLLSELRDQLQRFVADNDPFGWQDLAGRYDLLRRALRQAVEQANEDDPAPLLDECCRWLADDRAPGQIATFCREEYPRADVDVARLHRHARALLATAQAAVAAWQAVGRPAACERLLQWGREAADLLGGQAAEGVGELTCRWTDGDPAALIRSAFAALARLGWRVTAALHWTLHWLDAPVPQAALRLRVPVAGCHAGHGFLSDLTLTPLDGAEGQLVVHADSALRPLGKQLLAAVHAAWQRTGQGVRWALTVPEDGVPPWLPLDGDSLGAAATVGFRLLRERRPCDPACVLAARVDENGDLSKVGHEKEKLEAALRAGMKRAGVAARTDLTELEVDSFRGRGLDVQRLRTVEQAVELTSGLLTDLRRLLEGEVRGVLDDTRQRIDPTHRRGRAAGPLTPH
jgi:hypothetical protein